MKRACLLASLAALVFGCAEASKQNVPVDGSVPGIDAETPAVDSGPDATPKSPFWTECERGEECESGICWRRNTSDPRGRCTQPCTRTCPDDYECKTVRYTDTIELDLCIPAEQTFCDACAINRDCGDSSDLCISLTAGRYCSIDCKADPTVCPTGFTCQMLAAVGDVTNVWQCLPINGICCIDADRDLYGRGEGCAGGDCDDTDRRVYNGATEICDGVDNDCMGGIDVGQTDCKHAECSLGAFGYFERADEPCTAGRCVAQNARDCGLYTCDGGGEMGDHCATTCDGEVDTKCTPPAHCDASACAMDLPNGTACNESSDCQSNHCQNGFCCANGDCCMTASNCPTFGSFSPICEDTVTCQGSRGAAVCANNECGTQNGVADDSACGPTVEANSCNFYKSVFCSGMATQTAPACPTMCNSHADCDGNGFCDPASSTCREDLNDGEACGTESLRCKSGYCGNGFCCSDGDCCANERDCPASYSRAPSCDTPSACQGTVDLAQCVSSRCTTSTGVPDDSACVATTRASECGLWTPINCVGGTQQTPPVCPDSCTASAQCDGNAYCNPAGVCVPDEPDGGACTVNGDCQGGRCSNGYCCASGDCCPNPGGGTGCATYNRTGTCASAAMCQGSRIDGICAASHSCTTTVVNDDSWCAGLTSNQCGPYPAVQCTSALDQTSDQAGLCAASCINDNMCDVSAHCSSPTNGMCVPDQGPGGFCSTQNECGAGLTCVDNVCCTSNCNGQCMRCDVTGHVGTCWDIPAATDPDNECGLVDCSGFFAGWSGDSCRRKANVSAAAARCAGTGSRCRTQLEECNLQTAASTTLPPQITCQSFCQDPNNGTGGFPNTCHDQVMGSCHNVDQGTAFCGLGVCANSAPRCVMGQPNACVPANNASQEVCDNVDNDCNGLPDDDPNLDDSKEQNPSCSTLYTFPTVNSDGSGSASSDGQTVNVFPQGDVDVYRINMHENDSTCRACNPFLGISVDEDYRLYVNLTVPAGAGIYRFCLNNSCGLPNNCVDVPAGTSRTVAYSFDGGCDPFGGSDNYSAFVMINGANANSYECAPYTLTYFFDALVCVSSPGYESNPP